MNRSGIKRIIAALETEILFTLKTKGFEEQTSLLLRLRSELERYKKKLRSIHE